MAPPKKESKLERFKKVATELAALAPQITAYRAELSTQAASADQATALATVNNLHAISQVIANLQQLSGSPMSNKGKIFAQLKELQPLLTHNPSVNGPLSKTSAELYLQSIKIFAPFNVNKVQLTAGMMFNQAQVDSFNALKAFLANNEAMQQQLMQALAQPVQETVPEAEPAVEISPEDDAYGYAETEGEIEPSRLTVAEARWVPLEPVAEAMPLTTEVDYFHAIDNIAAVSIPSSVMPKLQNPEGSWLNQLAQQRHALADQMVALQKTLEACAHQQTSLETQLQTCLQKQAELAAPNYIDAQAQVVLERKNLYHTLVASLKQDATAKYEKNLLVMLNKASGSNAASLPELMQQPAFEKFSPQFKQDIIGFQQSIKGMMSSISSKLHLTAATPQTSAAFTHLHDCLHREFTQIISDGSALVAQKEEKLARLTAAVPKFNEAIERNRQQAATLSKDLEAVRQQHTAVNKDLLTALKAEQTRINTGFRAAVLNFMDGWKKAKALDAHIEKVEQHIDTHQAIHPEMIRAIEVTLEQKRGLLVSPSVEKALKDHQAVKADAQKLAQQPAAQSQQTTVRKTQ